MHAATTRPPRNIGPLEGRDFGPTGRRLGTAADCYDGSPWELHRGELVEQATGSVPDCIAIPLFLSLLFTHARPELTVMTDVYCDLSDALGESLRAPDVALVSGLTKPKDDFFRGTPILAVEVRATQSKRHLEEKVKLYVEHAWPFVWIAHTERQEIEVVRPGMAPVTYPRTTSVPLIPELDKHGLRAVPVAALFDEQEAARFLDGWVGARGEARGEAHGRAQAILAVLSARGLDVSEATRARVASTTDLALLDRWLTIAAITETPAAFTDAVG
jgi:Uma2 family endonuclease